MPRISSDICRKPLSPELAMFSAKVLIMQLLIIVLRSLVVFIEGSYMSKSPFL